MKITIKIRDKVLCGGSITLVTIAILVLSYALSWIVTCGVIKLITICFDLAFNWGVATGVWLISLYFKVLLKGIRNKESE